MRLLHLSDPHLQLRDWRTRPLRELGPLRALATVELWKGRGRLFDGAEASLRAWAQAGAGYDHVICTGDLTQLGLREELLLAREALGPLAADPARFTCLAGNHDRFPWAGEPQRWFEEVFPEQEASDLEVAPVRVRLLGEVALVVAGSAREVSWPVWSRGEIDARTLAALRTALAAPEVRARCALVLTHHAPLQRGGRPDLPFHGLVGFRRFLRTSAEGGAQAILCGHIHDRFQLPPAPERPRVICCGSSTVLGDEGAWELEVEGGHLLEPRPLSAGGR